MTRVGGPSETRPVGKAEQRGAEKPTQEGEFDRVMEEHGAGAGPEAAKPLPGGPLRRGLRGGGQPGGGGAGGGQPGDAGDPRLQQPGKRQGPGLSAPQLATTAAAALLPEGAPTAEATPPLAARQQVQLPAIPAQPALPTKALPADQLAAGEASVLEGAAARAKAGAKTAAEEGLPLEVPAAALPADGRALPPPQPQVVATVGPAAEVAPATPAGDPALVRQVAQQVLAGIEVHLVAGRTQVELGLDLGSLGQAQVELTRLPDKGVGIVFRLDTPDAQQAVSRNLPELVQALEQKGMTPQIDLRRGDGSPMGGEHQSRSQQQAQDQRQGRSRGDYVPVIEEES